MYLSRLCGGYSVDNSLLSHQNWIATCQGANRCSPFMQSTWVTAGDITRLPLQDTNASLSVFLELHMYKQAARHSSNFTTRAEQRSGFAKLSTVNRNQSRGPGQGRIYRELWIDSCRGQIGTIKREMRKTAT